MLQKYIARATYCLTVEYIENDCLDERDVSAVELIQEKSFEDIVNRRIKKLFSNA